MNEFWREDAACRGMDTAIFFPERGEDHSLARSICAGCPVSAECLEEARTMSFRPQGVWGGTSERGRRTMPKVRRLAPTAMSAAISHATNAGYQKHQRVGVKACDECKWAHALYGQESKERRQYA